MKQAMLLAAGLSTRLRPLTDNIPKPMLPFLGQNLLDWMLLYLRSNGIQKVAVNVHHGKGAFLDRLKNEKSIPIEPFVEEPLILHTGGGIKNMKEFVTEEHFAVVNCDFLTDVDLKAAFAFHLKTKSIATMVLIPHKEEKKYGAVGVNPEGKIVSFPYAKQKEVGSFSGIFSGIHIFSRSIFKHMPEKDVFDINRDVYGPLIDRNKNIFGFVSRSTWYDVGTIDAFADTQFKLMNQPLSWMEPLLERYMLPKPNVFIHPSVKLSKQVALAGPIWLSPNVTIAEGCSLGPNVSIGAGAKVGEGCDLRNVVLYPEVVIARKKKIRDRVYESALSSVSFKSPV